MSSIQASARKSGTQNTCQSTGYKVFVGGLPSDATNAQLYRYFAKFGQINSCNTRTWDTDASKCKGYAIMEVADQTSYQRITGMPHYWGGRLIVCKQAILKKKALVRHNKQISALKVFVTGLPWETTDADLHEYFSKFGPIEMAYIVTKYFKKTRIGYVCFRTIADKQIAKDWPNHRIKGQKIYVLDYQSHYECQQMKQKNQLSYQQDHKNLDGEHENDLSDQPGYGTQEKVQKRFIILHKSQEKLQSIDLSNSSRMGLGKQCSQIQMMDGNLRFNLSIRLLMNQQKHPVQIESK